MNTASEDRDVSRPGLVAQWFAIVAAPLAWSAHELLAYGFASFLCPVDPGAYFRPLGHALSWPFVVLTVLSFGLALSGAWTAVSIWRRTRVPTQSKLDPREISAERTAFMAKCGLINSAVFITAFLFTTADMVTAPLCGT